MNGMAGRSDRAFGMLVQMMGDGVYQFGRHQRFVALHVDDYRVIRPASLFHHLGDAVRAAEMGVARQAGLVAMFMNDVGNRVMIGGDPDALCAAFRCLFGDAHHHGLACDVQQRFPVQTGRGVASRDDDVKWQSLEFFGFFWCQFARFIGQHDRDAIGDFEGQTVCPADQFLLGLVIDERRFA